MDIKKLLLEAAEALDCVDSTALYQDLQVRLVAAAENYERSLSEVCAKAVGDAVSLCNVYQTIDGDEVVALECLFEYTDNLKKGSK